MDEGHDMPPPPGQMPGGPVPYPYPGPQVIVQPRPKTNGLAIASMILGILGGYLITAILALYFGYKARRQIDASNGTQGGRGMATAGIVLGWVMIPLSILNIIWMVVLFTRISHGDFPFNFPTHT